jgi:hypothetical protein
MAKQDSVYSGLAQFGRIAITIKTIFWLIIFALALISGIYLIFKKDNRPNLTTGTIAEASCTKNNKLYYCKLRVNYIVDNIMYQIVDTIHHTIPLKVGESIQVAYGDLPTDAKVEEISPRQLGIVIIIIVSFFLLLTLLSYWLVERFMALAALSGASTGLSLVGI